MTRRYLVVANANAGSSETARIDEAVDVLRAHGDVEQARTSSLSELDAALDGLAERTLVVAGGDGSLHAVVDRLHRRGTLADTPVALLPMGTGNDLARGVGLPLDPGPAARAVVDGHPRPMDLVEGDDGSICVNAAHAGLGAAAAVRSEGLKQALGPLAYPLGALVAGVRERGWELAVEVDGRRVPGEGAVLMVGVANGPSIGGGTLLCPDARFDDGQLDVVVVRAVGAMARIAFGTALRSGTHIARDDVTLVRGQEVRISGDPVGHDVDGEVTDEVTDRTYRLRAQAWTLLMP